MLFGHKYRSIFRTAPNQRANPQPASLVIAKSLENQRTVGCTAHIANKYVTTSQFEFSRLPSSDEMLPYVARTMEPSALAIKTPVRFSHWLQQIVSFALVILNTRLTKAVLHDRRTTHLEATPISCRQSQGQTPTMHRIFSTSSLPRVRYPRLEP